MVNKYLDWSFVDISQTPSPLLILFFSQLFLFFQLVTSQHCLFMMERLYITEHDAMITAVILCGTHVNTRTSNVPNVSLVCSIPLCGSMMLIECLLCLSACEGTGHIYCQWIAFVVHKLLITSADSSIMTATRDCLRMKAS